MRLKKFVVIGIASLMLAFGVRAKAETASAPLNGTISFTTDTAPSDTLNVLTGSQTVKADSATKIQGSANSRITVVTTPGSGTVHVADVVLRDGDSLYVVTGTYSGGGGGGDGDTGSGDWKADYNRGAARILLEVNQQGTSDDYVACDAAGDTCGTLTITISGGSSSDYYYVNIAITGNGTPAGDASLPATLGPVVLAGDGGTTTVPLKGTTAGGINITATTSPAGATTAPTTKPATIFSVDDVVVDDSDTKTEKISGGENFVQVKNNGDIIVKAKTTPDTTDIGNQIKWSVDVDSITVPGVGTDKRTGKISSAKSQKVTVVIKDATANKTLRTEYVWIVWATMTLGTKPADTIDGGNDATSLLPGHTWASPAGNLGGGNKCGPIDYIGTPALDYAHMIGKVQYKATLGPDGIQGVITNKWKMTRTVKAKAWDNGGHYIGAWAAGNSVDVDQDDTGGAPFTDLDPTSGTSKREIYDVDYPGVPTVSAKAPLIHTSELYANFIESAQLTLRGVDTKCSSDDDGKVQYIGIIDGDKAAGAQVQKNELKAGNMAWPPAGIPAYKPRFNISGTIKKAGAAIAGVTVSTGGKSATTAADGTYTIVGVEVTGAAVTITPKKGTDTFTPATLSVTLTDNDQSGQDFTDH